MSKLSAVTSKPYWQRGPKRLHGARWRCEWCGMKFHQYNDLVAHEALNHEDDGRAEFPGSGRGKV